MQQTLPTGLDEFAVFLTGYCIIEAAAEVGTCMEEADKGNRGMNHGKLERIEYV